jgi:hypothetical protein
MRYRACFAIVVLCLAAGCRKEGEKHPSQPPVIHYEPLPQQTPVPLATGTIEPFVDWVSSMPASQVDDVKQEIAKSASDAAVVDAVAAKLSFTAPGSYGRQLIYVSILGEMKNNQALSPLQSYLNSGDCPVFEQLRAVQSPGPANQTSYFDACAGLKSAAVNSLAYLNTPAARKLVLQAVQTHPSRVVRLSAMNAYLYNNNDSQEALAVVRRYAHKDEVKFVGLPRLTTEGSVQDFSDRVARYYQEHPEDKAQLPARIAATQKGKIEPHPRSPGPPRRGETGQH